MGAGSRRRAAVWPHAGGGVAGPGRAGMNGIGRPWQMRRELGRDLRARRKAAGWTQLELARRTGKSRSTISTIESATGGAASRAFWQACDEIFGTRGRFARRWDQVDATGATSRAAGREDPGTRARTVRERNLEALRMLADPRGVPEARDAYARLGWPVTQNRAVLDLATGTVADALEVPRPAGLLAIMWWLDSRGAADEIRGLPALPPPDQALAVIGAGPRCFFLARGGACPWPGAAPAAEASVGDVPVIGWHAAGGRVPLPPGPTGDGEHAEWAHLPSRGIRLASPFALLDLLAKAIVALMHQPDGLSLPGGIRAVPARRPPAPPAPPASR